MRFTPKIQNILDVIKADGLSMDLIKEDGIPHVTFWREEQPMTFDEATRIAARVQYLADFPVHFHQMTGDSISLFLFDPEPSFSVSDMLEEFGTPVAEWIAGAMSLPAPREPSSYLPTTFDYEGAPTVCQFGGFISAYRPFFGSNERTGKWCVTTPADKVDALWAQVRSAVMADVFASAVVSTPMQAASHGGSYMICVFTTDWLDYADVTRVREVLRSFGVADEIGYKRDLETLKGVFGGVREWVYHG